MDFVLAVGIDRETTLESLRLAQEHEFIKAAAGLHPYNADSFEPGDIDWFRDVLKKEEVVALGEVGLDYYNLRSPAEDQQSCSREFLKLAAETETPVILHVRPDDSFERDAYEDIFKLIEQFNSEALTGIFHCFAGDRETVEASLSFGFYYSFAGNVTYSGSDDLKQAAAAVPRENILVETDCPYLAPAAKRGKQNRPDYVYFTSRCLAGLRETTHEEFMTQVSQNSHSLLGHP